MTDTPPRTARERRDRDRLERFLAEIRRRYLTMAPGERDAAYTVGLEAPRSEGERPRVRVVKA